MGARVTAGGAGISSLIVTNGKYGAIVIIVLLPYIGWCDTRTNKKKKDHFRRRGGVFGCILLNPGTGARVRAGGAGISSLVVTNGKSGGITIAVGVTIYYRLVQYSHPQAITERYFGHGVFLKILVWAL